MCLRVGGISRGERGWVAREGGEDTDGGCWSTRCYLLYCTKELCRLLRGSDRRRLAGVALRRKNERIKAKGRVGVSGERGGRVGGGG